MNCVSFFKYVCSLAWIVLTCFWTTSITHNQKRYIPRIELTVKVSVNEVNTFKYAVGPYTCIHMHIKLWFFFIVKTFFRHDFFWLQTNSLNSITIFNPLLVHQVPLKIPLLFNFFLLVQFLSLFRWHFKSKKRKLKIWGRTFPHMFN